MTTRPGCLHYDQISALLENQLPKEKEAELVRHLDQCLLCQWRLERSTGATRELSVLTRTANQDEVSPGPAFHLAVESLKTEQADEPEGPAGDDPPIADLGFLQESKNPHLLGRFGRYEVLETIGRGGMGIVLKARDPLLDRITAIKILDPLLAGHATARKRFVREARAAAAVCHDNVIVIYGVAERDGLPYLVMPYVPGMSLAEKIQWFGPLKLVEILRIGMQTAAGLAAAHAQGIVHRDIKPANILLEGDVDRVKITDFGLAQVVDDVSLTQSGTIAGTPEYMSPEQADEGPLDHRSDLFSLGSVLYAMCTGLPPFPGATSLAVIRRVCDDEPRAIRELNPQIPEWMVRIIGKLHHKRPEDRFHSAAQVSKLLRKQLARLQRPRKTKSPQTKATPTAARSRTKSARPDSHRANKQESQRAATSELQSASSADERSSQQPPPMPGQTGWTEHATSIWAWATTHNDRKRKWRQFWNWMSKQDLWQLWARFWKRR